MLRTWKQPRDTDKGMSRVAGTQDHGLRVPLCPGRVGDQPRKAQKEWTLRRRHGGQGLLCAKLLGRVISLVEA